MKGKNSGLFTNYFSKSMGKVTCAAKTVDTKQMELTK